MKAGDLVVYRGRTLRVLGVRKGRRAVDSYIRPGEKRGDPYMLLKVRLERERQTFVNADDCTRVDANGD